MLTHIDGTALDETHSYMNTLFHYNPGNQVTVAFARDAQPLQAQVTLGESNPN